MKELNALKNCRRWTSAAPGDGRGVEGTGRLKQLRRWTSAGLPGLTDTGVKELAGMKQMQTLYLFGTAVTDAGVADLKKALPGAHIVK